MPTLQELKDKWFLNVNLANFFPPQKRHPGTQVSPYTDNNLVEVLIDGYAIMSDFNDRIDKMITSPADPTQHEMWITSWRIDPVKLLGLSNPTLDAEKKILNAADNGLKVYYLGSGHFSRDNDAIDFAVKLGNFGSNGASDKRFPVWGCHHQKFQVFHGPSNDWVAVLGSADLSFTRWDTPEHLDINPDRPEEGGPTHDLAVIVRGPVVHDIALSFAERWNDITNRDRTEKKIDTTISTGFLSTPIPPPAGGTHSIQVLRTYPIEANRGYSWSEQGEFTIWAAYLNAIKNAGQYIYVEDQYFYTFGDPPAIEEPAGTLRDSDLVYQLGEALKRGVDVVILVPGRSEDLGAWYQLYQRGKAAHYLKDIADSQAAPVGRFVICSLKVGNKEPVVHSKLMIVDDEFVLIGSANFNQRSMTHDTEIHLGIIDSLHNFAKILRISLWQEHMEITDSNSIDDPAVGVGNFHDNAENELGRLRIFPTDDPGSFPCCHGLIMNHIIDPYKGPERS